MANKPEFNTTFACYKTTRNIGEGGSGYIFEVLDEEGQRYAAKLLKTQGINSEKRRRFKNEINFCQKSCYRNILKVIDHGIYKFQGIMTPFYIMPYFDSSLRKEMNKENDLERLIQLFSQILDGVEAAHSQKVFHRDIKPENILYDSNNNNLVIADFGIAHFIQEDLYTAVETNSQERLANFLYAAPEQRSRGKAVDNRADIFALGLILNEMFTHEIPQGSRYRKIESVASEYSFLDEIVEIMISQNPNERPHSIQEIRQRIKILSESSKSERINNNLKSAMTTTEAIDDPLISNPIKIIDFNWGNGNLTLVFNQKVNNLWVEALRNMRYYESVKGKDPNKFVINENQAQISARDDEVQIIIDSFKSWIPQATQRYEEYLCEAIRSKREKEERELKIIIEEEEKKKRLRETIKL